MLKFTIGVVSLALTLPIYLGWARRESERQIDKMQTAVFNSPGAEAPVPPTVLLVGVVVLLAQFVWVRQLLGMGPGRTIFSLLLGNAAGTGIFLTQQRD